jgi:hypothetical protein
MINKLMKKSQPQAAPVVGPSLADRIKDTCAAAEAYVETIALREKAEAPTIPLDWHRMNLHMMHGRCPCRCALKLLELAEKK